MRDISENRRFSLMPFFPFLFGFFGSGLGRINPIRLSPDQPSEGSFDGWIDRGFVGRAPRGSTSISTAFPPTSNDGLVIMTVFPPRNEKDVGIISPTSPVQSSINRKRPICRVFVLGGRFDCPKVLISASSMSFKCVECGR